MKKDFTKQDFYDLLKPNGDCLEWTGCINSQGYGQTRCPTLKKAVLTHRLALELEGVDVKPTDHVLHSCNNRLCCNPNHLRVGTHIENMHDKYKDGTDHIGEKNPSAKLTEQDVLDIRHLRNQGVIRRILAERFNVSTATISDIQSRRSWSHI